MGWVMMPWLPHLPENSPAFKDWCKWVRKWIPETAADRPELKLRRQREGNGTTFDGLF